MKPTFLSSQTSVSSVGRAVANAHDRQVLIPGFDQRYSDPAASFTLAPAASLAPSPQP